MNATQVGDAIKAILLALGVSSTVVGYISSELWTAIGGFVLALGSFIWMIISHNSAKLIGAVANDPAVAQITVRDPKILNVVQSNKVVPHRRSS